MAFSTKIKGHHHLQGSVQVYNVRIPVWTGALAKIKLGTSPPFGRAGRLCGAWRRLFAAESRRWPRLFAASSALRRGLAAAAAAPAARSGRGVSPGRLGNLHEVPPFSPTFLGEGSPTKIDHGMGTLILASLPDHLVQKWEFDWQPLIKIATFEGETQ